MKKPCYFTAVVALRICGDEAFGKVWDSVPDRPRRSDWKAVLADGRIVRTFSDLRDAYSDGIFLKMIRMFKKFRAEMN